MEKLQDKILSILKDDARTSADEMAEMLGVEVKEVEKCVKALEKSGVIVKYTAVVNDERT